jgi:hypothetical protein
VPTHLPSPCRTAAAVVVVAVLAGGCHPTPSATVTDDPVSVAGDPSFGASTGRSPVAYAVGSLQTATAAGGPGERTSIDTPPAAAGRAGPAASAADAQPDPEVVAARLVTDRLAAEGLETVWVDTRLLETTGLEATVQVQVAHSLGRGHPTQTGYQLTLTRSGDGWRLERLVEAG